MRSDDFLQISLIFRPDGKTWGREGINSVAVIVRRGMRQIGVLSNRRSAMLGGARIRIKPTEWTNETQVFPSTFDREALSPNRFLRTLRKP